MGSDNDATTGLRRNTTQVVAAIGFFVTSGPLLVIINKVILRDNALHLPAFVSAMGIIFTSIFTHTLVALGKVQVKPNLSGSNALLKQLLPVGLCSAGTFMFGNMSYVYLDAGFIQMLKAGTPAMLLFMLVAFKIEKISPKVGFFVLFMVAGSVIAVADAPNPNTFGLLVMVASEICEGARCILTQVFLQRLEFSVWDAGYYMAPVTAACCLLLSLITEMPAIFREGKQDLLLSQWTMLVASGTVGIAVNFASFLLIKLTSSLLTKLLVAARNAGLVLFFITRGESYTSTEVYGYLITLIAFTGYSVVKVLEARPPKAKVEEAPDGETEMA